MPCTRFRRLALGGAALVLLSPATNASAQSAPGGGGGGAGGGGGGSTTNSSARSAETVGSLPGQSAYQGRVGQGVLDTCTGLVGHAKLGGSSARDDLFTQCTALVVTGFSATGSIQRNPLDFGFDVKRLLKALDDVGHDEFAGAGAEGINIVTGTIGVLETRMVALRDGDKGIRVAGNFVDSLGQRHDGADIERALREDSAAGSLLGDRLGLFVNGFGNWAQFDGNSEEAAFQTSEGGFVVGGDYRFTDELVAGVAFGTSFSDSNLSGIGSGDLDRRAISGSVYGTWQRGGFFVDGIGTYSNNQYDITRDIRYLSRTARGDTDADEWGVALGTGYDFTRDAWKLSPYGRAEYIGVKVHGFTEHGAQGLDLRYQSTDVRSLVTDLGMKLERAFSTSFGVVSPYARAAWKHEFLNDSRHVTATFAADPNQIPFFLVTASPDRDYADVGAGATLTLQGGWSAFADFDTLLGLRDIQRYTLTLGARLQF